MYFGSQYNGVTSAITQFLGVIALVQAGISGVTIAALYKPLAEGNTYQISVIVKSTESFLRRVALFFIGAVMISACVYPFLVIEEFDWFFTASLFVIMSLSTYAFYFIGYAYQQLPNADQQMRIMHIINTVKTITYTAMSALLIFLGFGIHAVKLSTSVVYILAALFTVRYIKRKYKLEKNVKKDYSTIKQRWDNFSLHIASFISANSAIVWISVFMNVYAVSVYTVYNLVTSGVIYTFRSITNGINAAFGNMLAKDEQDLLRKNFNIYEQVVFALVTFLFGVTAVMILPFVSVYTAEVTDVNYIEPIFAYIIIGAAFFSCIRVPYEGLVTAAGHFRQMRNPAFIEAIINTIVSIALIFKLGIVGVAIGTLAAYTYRTLLYTVYMSRNIIKRSFLLFIKRLIMSLVCILVIIAVSTLIPLSEANDFFTWAFNAIIISLVAVLTVLFAEVVFYRNDLIGLTKLLKTAIKK